MTGAPCIFGEVPQGPRQHPDQPCRPRWQLHLPAEWRDQTVVPRSFRVYREYEVPARRVIGRDRQGEPCFCACDYRMIELRSDDDEDLYPALTYAEALYAWRLLDGRWLVHRRLLPYGDEGDFVAGLRFEERMPR